MIDFHRLKPSDKEAYEEILFSCPPRGCEYSFANLTLWGRQHAAFIHGCVVFFSHYYGKSVYPYPIGSGDKKAALEAVLHDANTRGIPCRLTGMTDADREELEALFPGQFTIRSDRNGFDYVYAIDDLADLKGRKFQKKRNHVNRFRTEHPDFEVVPLTVCNMAQAQHMINEWFQKRMREDPHGDYLLENIALSRACQNYAGLGMEGILLLDGGEVLAVTMGSRMGRDTFDIHFEKAREDVEGAYAAVNCEFARYLRLKYPDAAYLDREDDMGLEGLRKAKLSYNPHHLIAKHRAYLLEDIHGD
nr:DUF2156 domain-containing protein [Oscillospiraceae bacterium]